MPWRNKRGRKIKHPISLELDPMDSLINEKLIDRIVDIDLRSLLTQIDARIMGVIET
jgi:hypothetical protein